MRKIFVVRSITRLAVLAVLSVLPAAMAQADMLTTLFAANNGGNLGGAVYFDANVGANPLEVTGFDTNTTETVAFTNFQVWVLPGLTSQGNETSAAWVQVATGSGTGAGFNNPTSVTLSNSFLLSANTLTGIALVMDPAIGHDYTNGTGANQFFSNADLSITLGSASNVPFTLAFTPRVWNGTIYYNAVPEPASLAFPGIGAIGLIGLARRRRS